MRLTDCFTDMIAYTMFLLQSGTARQVDFDRANQDIEQLARNSERLHEKIACSKEDYLLSRFAVFAWIDEAIMGSSWEEKEKWQRNHLQQRYYQTADAGELFFQRLNTLGPHQNQVREVYYLCLALGFTGQYCNAGDEFMLDQLKTSNLKLITGSSVELPSLSSMKLFPDGYPRENGQRQTRRYRRLSSLGLISLVVPVGVFGGLLLIYNFILRNLGEAIISRIH